MIIVKIFAGLIIFITVAAAVLSQFFVVVDKSEQQIEASDAQAVIGTAPTIEVRRRAGAVVCKFDPVTESPQQFAADYLFGDLLRIGDLYEFSARVAVPSGGYTASFGNMSLVGTQAILEARLNKPTTQALEMMDTVSMQTRVQIPLQAITLRVVLRRPFAWGPDSLICSVVRPAAPAPVAPVVAPAPANPAPVVQ